MEHNSTLKSDVRERKMQLTQNAQLSQCFATRQNDAIQEVHAINKSSFMKLLIHRITYQNALFPPLTVYKAFCNPSTLFDHET